MKSALFYLNVLICGFSMAQDISGFWKGDIYQGSKHFNTEATFWKIDSVNYRCYMKIIDFEEYGLFHVKASLNGGILSLEDNVLL